MANPHYSGITEPSNVKPEVHHISVANDTEFASVLLLRRDLNRMWRVAEASNTASSASTPGIISTEVAPFWRREESGMGREGRSTDRGLSGIKYLCMGGVDR